jgi:hypothetical protein
MRAALGTPWKSLSRWVLGSSECFCDSPVFSCHILWRSRVWHSNGTSGTSHPSFIWERYQLVASGWVTLQGGQTQGYAQIIKVTGQGARVYERAHLLHFAFAFSPDNRPFSLLSYRAHSTPWKTSLIPPSHQFLLCSQHLGTPCSTSESLSISSDQPPLLISRLGLSVSHSPPRR